MLANVFSKILNMSLTASVVVLVVYLARIVLKKAPKIYSYILWSLVLFRLLCPVSILSSFSLIPDRITSGQIISGWEDDYVASTMQAYTENQPEFEIAVEAGREPYTTPDGQSYVLTGSDGISEPDTVENTIFPLLANIWVAGILVLSLHSVISYLRIRKQTRVVVPYDKHVYIADDVVTPFVMGIFQPTIYLPATLEETERKYIIAHEQHHIRRGDHVFKALGFLALTIHWFNPLVWFAFVLAGRDMEMSCDEAVIRKMGADIRADYSASLLNLATGHRLFSITPLAFGEGNPTGRVRNLTKWKKPTFWVVMICVVLCIVLAACLLTDPKMTKQQDKPVSETVPTELVEIAPTAQANDDWGVSILLQDISRTEVTFTFLCDGLSLPGKVIYHYNILSLERMENGNWVTVEGFPGYEPDETAFPVVNGDIWNYTWKWEFGELPDGQYRLGKQLFLKMDDEERIVYCEFFITDDTPIAPLPLESGEPYADNGEKTEQVHKFRYLEQFNSETELEKAVLEFEGEPLVTASDAAQLDSIYHLFRNADVLGYEPKTHSTGLQLHLVLTFEGGETVTIDLDPDHDVCKIDDEFVFYGEFDEPDYIEKLWQYLGISAWPDPVYEKYPGAYKS